MKYLVLIVVLLGFACGSEEEEVSLQDLEDIEGDGLSVGRQTLEPNLIIGNIVAALNSLNTTDLNSIISSLLGGGTTAGLGGLLVKPLTGIPIVKGVIAGIVSTIAAIIDIPIQIATTILGLVGLVLLILFLIEGGDFGTLVSGIGRSSSFMPTFDYDFVHNPVVESVSQMFFSAMEKYD